MTDAELIELVIKPEGDASVIPKGQEFNYDATAYYSDGTDTDVSSVADWQSADDAIATAHEDGGVFDAIALGSTEVSATYNGMTSNKAEVEVITAEFKSMTVGSTEKSYPEGMTIQFTGTIAYAPNYEFTITNQKNAYWQSDNSDIATVALNGEVTTVAPGNVNIKLSFNGYTATKNIDVTETKFVDFTISPQNNYFVGEGHTRQLTAIAEYDNGSYRDITNHQDLQWSKDTFDNGYYSTGGQVNPAGLLYHFPTQSQLSYFFYVQATFEENYLAHSIATFGATHILTNTDKTLNFIGPLTDVDAELVSYTNFELRSTETGITGPSDSEFIILTFEQATALCDTLSYDGFDDYRLPSYAELQAVWPDYDGYSDDTYDLYSEEKWALGYSFWTSTYVDESQEGQHKLVNLSTGQTDLSSEPTSKRFYVSCVREVITE